MLTDIERQQIEEELAHGATPEAGCIEALKVVQQHRGWVSDEAVADLVPVLGMSPAEIDSVATFYNLIFRRPVGKHVIMVCDSVSCWVCGEERVMQHLTRKLGVQPGETTPDGLFTLLVICCLGHCDQAPAMMLDGEIVGNLTEGKIDEMIERLRSEGIA